VSSSIPDTNPEDISTDATAQTGTGTGTDAEVAASTAGSQPDCPDEHLAGGLDESGTYLLSCQDGSWIAREVTPLIIDDLDTNAQAVIQLIRTPAALIGPTTHPAARHQVEFVCAMRDLNTYGMSDQFGEPKGTDYPETVRETATNLLATIWTATGRYDIAAYEWNEHTALIPACLDMAVHLTNRPQRHAAADEGS
jgi:hypothetical protein